MKKLNVALVLALLLCAVPALAVAPVAAFTTTQMAPYYSGMALTMEDSSTNTPTSWTWNMGDGTSYTSEDVMHVYRAAGTYLITHTATNADGTGSVVVARSIVTLDTGGELILYTNVNSYSHAFSIDGLERAYVHVEALSGTATATVVIAQRTSPVSSWQTIKTITDPTAGDVAYSVEPVGEIRVTVTGITVGTVRVTLRGFTYDGKAKW